VTRAVRLLISHANRRRSLGNNRYATRGLSLAHVGRAIIAKLTARVTASSTGLLLKTIGLKISAAACNALPLPLTCQHVSSIKVDPYLNVDAGTMNPKE
jgi:hypothetical protein